MATRLTGPYTSQSIAVTDETQVLHVYSTHTAGHRGMTFLVYSSAIAATATVKYIEPGGGERILSTAAVPAGGTDITVLDYDLSVPEAKLYITLGSASASTITAEAMVY